MEKTPEKVTKKTPTTGADKRSGEPKMQSSPSEAGERAAAAPKAKFNALLKRSSSSSSSQMQGEAKKLKKESEETFEIKKERDEKEESKRIISRSGSEVSRWINWDGRQLQVELGGRRIKNAAATAVARLVQSVLEKCKARQPGKWEVSLNLAGNCLGKDGLMVLLQAVEAAGKRVSCLNVEWNRIDANAAMWLASWISKQSSAPRKLLLSHNRSIGDTAAQHLFQTIGRLASSKDSSMFLPWIEAKYIGIKDPDAFLELLSMHVNFCFALDQDACSPDACASGASSGAGPTHEVPQLHLVGILEQRTETPAEPCSEPASSTKPEKLPEVQNGFPSEKSRESQEAETEESPEVSKVKTKSEGTKQDRKMKHFAIPADAEREERHLWASSLGKSGLAQAPVEDLPTPAPSRGMWDLVRAEAKKSRKELKRHQKEMKQLKQKESSESKAETRKDANTSKAKYSADFQALSTLVDGRVRRKTELWKALAITESEKDLRRKCLVDELCKQIFEEGFKTATDSGGSWEAYLKTSIGHQQVVQWLDKKLSKAAAACKPR